MLNDKLRDCLMQRQELLGAWLFGSQASGRARADSDVDVAFLADRALTFDERLSLQLEVESALGQSQVDIVDLRRATSILQYEAMQGIRLFVRSQDQVAAFSSLVGREYESDMALIQRGYRDRKDRL